MAFEVCFQYPDSKHGHFFFLGSRVSCRLVVLLKALLKLICDVAGDSSLTPGPIKSTLLEEATDCLILLDHCSQGQVKVSDSL